MSSVPLSAKEPITSHIITISVIDRQLLIDAREEALAWLQKGPGLRSRESAGLREILKHRWGQRLQLGAVG